MLYVKRLKKHRPRNSPHSNADSGLGHSRESSLGVPVGLWAVPLPGMLLKPTVPGLCAMLQTIYETESCFSSDSTAGTSMPSTGE
ncbi:hypothetical protein Q7C36_014048 [Tachysurus vachellii]|uniref:Uncharacterized protein n=1 Tax=Tachysurus vachellii TaxID=175792 RepID=A0AA88MHB4_TACVA|nr:hypothetical protein Q7C36_014048 [Tachysurus vachellii]